MNSRDWEYLYSTLAHPNNNLKINEIRELTLSDLLDYKEYLNVMENISEAQQKDIEFKQRLEEKARQHGQR